MPALSTGACLKPVARMPSLRHADTSPARKTVGSEFILSSLSRLVRRQRWEDQVESRGNRVYRMIDGLYKCKKMGDNVGKNWTIYICSG